MATFVTLANEKGAAVTSGDALNFVSSTTHPLTQEQTNV